MPLETIRTQVLERVKQTMQAMTTPTYWYEPRRVERYLLNPLTDKEYPHYSIAAAEEDKEIGGSEGYASLVTCDLPVTIAGAMEAVEPYGTGRAVVGERMLADMERVVMSLDKQTIGGCALQITIQKAELEITIIEAPLVLCGLFALFRYRHKEGEPGLAH